MRVILISVGTDGDIFPYVGVGRSLQSRGFTVTLLASEHYRPLSAAHGFEFHPLVSERENDELFSHPDFWNPLKTAPLMARWGVRFIQRQYELLADLVTGDTVLVANPGVFAASLVHETTGTPLVNLALQPWMIRSSIAPPVLPGLGFLRPAPKAVWRAIWRGLDAGVDLMVAPTLNRVRSSLGLRPTRRIFKNWLSPQLVLGLFPEWYGPPQADWPSQLRLTGFPLFDGGLDDGLAPRVGEWCRAGTPPIAFTFGTGMAHPTKLFRSALETCSILGARGIFLTKHAEKLPAALPSHVLHVNFAPFQKLFPECAAVVHHGGIGTAAQAMAAGRPQLIRPLCFDQTDNGVRAKELGVGDWLKPGSNEGRRMAEALKPLLTQATESRCHAIAERVKAEDGLESAARLVEEFATGHLITHGSSS